MDDKLVTDRIIELAREEHELFERESQGAATEEDRGKPKRIQVLLDQCWDLLRQRRAKREFGFSADEARVRDEKTVEGDSGRRTGVLAIEGDTHLTRIGRLT